MSIMKRIVWTAVDSRQFRSQEHIIGRQHASVLAELSFLRQILLMAPANFTLNKSTKDSIVFDNMAILKDGMERGVPGIHISPSTDYIRKRSNSWLAVLDPHSPDSAPMVPVIKVANDRAMLTAELEAEPVMTAPLSSNTSSHPAPPPSYRSASPQTLYSNPSLALSAVTLAQSSNVALQHQGDYTLNSPPPTLRASSVSAQHTGLLLLCEDPFTPLYDTPSTPGPLLSAVELPTPNVEARLKSLSSTASHLFNLHHRGSQSLSSSRYMSYNATQDPLSRPLSSLANTDSPQPLIPLDPMDQQPICRHNTSIAVGASQPLVNQTDITKNQSCPPGSTQIKRPVPSSSSWQSSSVSQVSDINNTVDQRTSYHSSTPSGASDAKKLKYDFSLF